MQNNKKTELREDLDIAVIGMAGRFPGAKNLQEFWNKLSQGKELITHFSKEELLKSGLPESLLNNPNYVRSKGFLENSDHFDAQFFGMSPREVQYMDPQHRLFLETAWHSLEDAGYNPYRYKGLIGVFAGSSINTYLLNNILPTRRNSIGEFQLNILNDKDSMPTRVAYKLNLRGPAVCVQTGCSTSLVAVHLACQSLLNYESDIVLAGASAVTFPDKAGYLYEKSGILSSDGHCRAFDSQANGTVDGCGVGIVVLKRLSDAIADKDNIRAIIKGSAINNDGSQKVSFTAPSIAGQSEVIEHALSLAGINPETISYIEAHGTGTNLGDPIEIAALTRAFRKKTDKNNFCSIGSVKTNIGHLDVAAGVTGLIKTILLLENKQIPPSLHYKSANSQIDFKNSPFYVSTKLKCLENETRVNRAGVSSFGVGGTNVHIVLQEGIKLDGNKQFKKNQTGLFYISAKSEAALEQLAQDYAIYLNSLENDQLLENIEYTLLTGRGNFKYKKVVIFENKEDIIESLSSDQALHSSSEVEEKSIFFMFPGQGSQYCNMARELYSEPYFKDTLDNCFNIAARFDDLDLKSIIFNDDNNDIDNTEFTQPCLFVIEYSLAKLLMYWNVKPSGMIGHSVGEFVSACLAGVMSLEDAIKIICMRGKFISSLPTGKMLSVRASYEKLQLLLNKTLAIAAINAPNLLTVSGSCEDIEEFSLILKSENILYKAINTSHPFHNDLLEPAAASLVHELSKIRLNAPSIPFISNVTGEWIKQCEAMDPNYWGAHLLGTVKFASGIQKICSDYANAILLEIGPGTALSTMTKLSVNSKNFTLVNTLPVKELAKDESKIFTKAIANILLAGVDIDWEKYFENKGRYKVSLPNYPFQSLSYKLEQIDVKSNQEKEYSVRRDDISNWFYQPSWKRISLNSHFTTQNLENSCVLILGNNSFIHEEIKKILQIANISQVQVIAGDSFVKRLGTYQVNPSNYDDLISLFNDLKIAETIPSHIIYFGAFDSVTTSKEIEYFQQLSNLFQAIVEVKFKQNIKLTILSQGLFSVTGEEIIYPEKSLITGLCKVVSKEITNIQCKIIDVKLDYNLNVNNIIPDIFIFNGDMFVAYRGRYRWIEHYALAELNKLKGAKQSGFKYSGAYLITGGLSGIGLAIASHLQSAYNAKLILVSRTKIPSREKWESYLQEKHNDRLSSILQELKSLKLDNSNILYIEANVANQVQINNAFDEAYRVFKKIDGVIHCAGSSGGGLISLKTQSQVEKVFSPKVQGTKNIGEIIKNKGIDFFAICSSLASILGEFGQSDYASANAFIDSFASNFELITGIRTIAINWGAWSETGMATDSVTINKKSEIAKSVGIITDLTELEGGIKTEEGIEAFEQIIASSFNQVIVTPYNLKYLIAQQKNFTINNILTNKTNDNSSKHTRSIANVKYESPTNEIEEKLCHIWEELFGIDKIGIKDNFFELGGDSLIAIQISSKIFKELNIDISVSELFISPTIEELAKMKSKLNKLKSFGLSPHPIKKLDRSKNYALSFAQERLWFLDQLEGANPLYNICLAYKLEGNLDKAALKFAFNQIIKKHEILRTSFKIDPVTGEPLQIINDPYDIELAEINFQGISDEAREERIMSWFRESSAKTFDLAQDRLLRAELLKLKENQYIISIVIHHILADGWSVGILNSELRNFYNTFKRSEANELDDLSIQYVDYSIWQREYLGSKKSNEDLDYWKKQLADCPKLLQLPIDRPRPAVQSYKGNLSRFKLDANLVQSLKELSQKNNVTLFILLLSIYKLLLSRYCSTEDIFVGSPIANRNNYEIEKLIGFFANTLIIRSQVLPNDKFLDLLVKVNESCLEAYEHQDMPFEKLVKELSPERNLAHSPLFQVMFAFQNSIGKSLQLDGLEVIDINLESQTSKFDLSMLLEDTENGLEGYFEYNNILFRDESINRMAKNFIKLLNEIVRDPSQLVGEINILDKDERDQLLIQWNNTNHEIPNLCIHEMFENQVKISPQAIAIIDEGQAISYRELNERTNKLAHFLRKRGIKGDDLIAIFLETSIEMVVGVIAVLKAGGAYVPLDPNYPRERLGFMLENSDTNIILTTSNLENELPDLNKQIVCLDKSGDEANSPSENLDVNISQKNLAYVIYTSGSTGVPKGVSLEHKAIVNRLIWIKDQFKFEESNVMLMKTSISFDASVWEIFIPLITGGKLIVMPQLSQSDPDKLINLIIKHNVTTLQLVPYILNLLIKNQNLNRCKSLTQIFVGGGTISEHMADSLYENLNVKLYNVYGPTEAGEISIFYHDRSSINYYNHSQSLPIGKPIYNTQFYIVDSIGNIAPIGVAGELYIGGSALAREYLNQPGLTGDKFISNKFLSENKILNSDQTRLYRTGDLVKYLFDGNIEFLGRIDDQVKIRGVRIEISEIEIALSGYPGVDNCIVTVREDVVGEKILVGFILKKSGFNFSSQDVRNYLNQKLPISMSLSHIAFIDEIPLLPNGKVNRHGLPYIMVKEDTSSVTFNRPQGPLEEILAEIWSEVLNIDNINRDDNFFSLGGHSLLATQIINRVRNIFEIKVTLKSFFSTPTIFDMAKNMTEHNNTKAIDKVIKMWMEIDE